jgi:hypothetical protein
LRHQSNGTIKTFNDGEAKNPRLAAAAKALIEAANLEADSCAQTKLAQNLDVLKTSLDAKINALNQHAAGVKSEIGDLKSLMEEEFKTKTLERARGLVYLGSFNYSGKDGIYNEYTNQENSSEIAESALEWFSLGY